MLTEIRPLHAADRPIHSPARGFSLMADSTDNHWRSRAAELLPTWFTERLVVEGSRFGVLLATGHVLIIDAVKDVRQGPTGQVWLDVEMLIPFRKDGFPWGHFPVVKSTSHDRAACSINAAHIVAAVEVDTWDVPNIEPVVE
jgi:hypothetical protein